MTNRERFQKVLSFEKPDDRLPVTEWATWWDKTIVRWQGEGLPTDLEMPNGICDYLGLDSMRQLWVSPMAPGIPFHPASHDCYHMYIQDADDYAALKPRLYSLDYINTDLLETYAKQQKSGDICFWITLEGFFWFPRNLFGVTEHLFSFYDRPELMTEICQDLCEYNLKVYDLICDYLVPDFMTFAEDMSYNHGAMCSQKQFNEFLAPYYRRIVPVLKERGTVPFVDSDGDVTDLIGWMMGVGIEGFLPLERMAGVDISRLRQLYPTLKMIGAFDKTVMHLGEARMRQEFERIFPVMCQGGYIPGCDHQTPPQVSFEDYHLYQKLLREYCEKAVK